MTDFMMREQATTIPTFLATRTRFFIFAVTIFLSSFALYFLTLAPGVLGGDPGELQFVPYFLGLTHPSGYPVQILLDKIWISIIPWGSIAWRTNLLSAVIASLGITFMFIYGVIATRQLLIPLLGASMVGITFVYWSQAVLADKYAMNGLLTATLLVVSYLFWRQPNLKHLTILSFFTGLSLAHHRALAVFIPAIGILVIVKGWNLFSQIRTWLASITAFTIPLSLYLIVYFSRKDIPPYFVSSFNISLFFDYLLFWGSKGQIRFLPSYPSLLNYTSVFKENFYTSLALFGSLGLLFAYRKNRKKLGWLLFLVANFLISGYFSANYENYEIIRRYVYYIPSYVFFGAIMIEGLSGWKTWLKQRPFGNWLAFGLLSIVFLSVAIPLPSRFWIQWKEQKIAKPLDSWRQILKSGQMGDRMAASLALVQDDNALIVADWEQATPLWYAQLIDGNCPRCMIRHYMDRLDSYRDMYPGRPIYVARTLPGADAWSEPISVGPLVKLDSKPIFEYEQDDRFLPLNLLFDNNILLKGIHWVWKPDMRPGGILSFELIWQRPYTENTPPPYSISLRLVGDNVIQWQNDQSAPVLAMHPFDQFAPGQIVPDFYEIPIPATKSIDAYKIQLILYQNRGTGVWLNAKATTLAGEPLGESPTIYAFQLSDK